MSTDTQDPLEKAIRQSGQGWLIDDWGSASAAIARVRQLLTESAEKATILLGGNAPEITEAKLLEDYSRNPHRVSAFFQIFGGSCTPEILIMAWRLMEGADIRSVTVEFRREVGFKLHIIFESPDDESYISTDINDFRIFRHIGIMKVDGAPAFDGFYPLHVR